MNIQGNINSALTTVAAIAGGKQLIDTTKETAEATKKLYTKEQEALMDKEAAQRGIVESKEFNTLAPEIQKRETAKLSDLTTQLAATDNEDKRNLITNAIQTLQMESANFYEPHRAAQATSNAAAQATNQQMVKEQRTVILQRTKQNGGLKRSRGPQKYIMTEVDKT